MKKFIKVIIIAICSIIVIIMGLVILGTVLGNGKLVVPIKQKDFYKNDKQSKFPSRLHVKKNQIVDAQNKAIIFKGLMAPDPQRLDVDKKFNKKYYDRMWTTGANVIRVPVHPDRWINDKYYIWRYLDNIVTWAGEAGVYVIIDWHYIGNIATGEGNEMPKIKEKPRDLTMKFWEQTSRYFKDTPNVIFEIYNEPANIAIEDWYKNAKDIIKTIRNAGAEQMILVGGIDYSYDLSWVNKEPILDNNAAYTSHVFPIKNNWDYNFGDIAKAYPVVVTEWGFMDENRNQTKQKYLIANEDSFGRPLLEYMENKGIGWVACWYDDGWEPPMFKKNYNGYTNYGNFILKALKK